MYKYEANAGERYGRLTLIRETTRTSKKHIWLCKCDCGKYIEASIYAIKDGNVKSCGCLKHERTVERNHQTARHNMSRTRMYRIWNGMIERCHNPNNKDFHNYGERGIEVCSEWRDFVAFHEWSMSHGYGDGLTIDRIDTNGKYEPSNCRWVSMKEQQRNRRSNRSVSYKGETHCLSEWADILGIPYKLIYKRIARGWTPEQAFETPSRKVRWA